MRFKDEESGYTLYADSAGSATGFSLKDSYGYSTETCVLNLNALKRLRAFVELEIDRLTPKQLEQPTHTFRTYRSWSEFL